MEKAARAAAEAAAKILRRYYGRVASSDIDRKGRNDFASFVDRKAESAIVSAIRKRFPDHAFLGEEGGVASGIGDVRWIIDPLDGTTNYLRQHNRFAVSIAAESKGRLLYGLVLDVLHREWFTAKRGGGAFLNGRRVFVSEGCPLREALILFGTPFRQPAPAVRRFARLFAVVQNATGDHRREGVAALDLASVACGRAEAFYELGLKPWDVAAGTLLVQEAGGWIGDFRGDNVDLFRSTFLASNCELKKGLLKIFRSARI